MKIAIFAAATAEDSNRFWQDTPGIDSIDFHDDAAALGALIRSGDGPDVVVARLEGDQSSSQILGAIARQVNGTPVVAWVPEISAKEAFTLSYLGAEELITDQTSPSERSLALSRAEARRRTSAASETPGLLDEPWRRQLVGSSCSMRLVTELIRLVSPRRCTVLITGETGTGKELVARAIHSASSRASYPMVSINCNAIPAELLEAELFGHVKGAYTGAFSSRVGRFEQANRGTLFLDEIGDLPFSLQAKLLRVLQEREFQRLGSSETVRVDVRVVAATNAHLQTLVEQGKFRQDLYYRLNVAPIQLPSLRERLEDIPELALHFVEKICRNEQIPVKAVPEEIQNWLATFPWPGNVRQLENTIESAIAMSGMRSTLRMADFSALLGGSMRQPRLFAMPSDGIDYNNIVGQFEKTLLTEALRLAGGSKKRAATLLGLKRTTFSAKLDALQVDANELDLDGEDEAAPYSAIA